MTWMITITGREHHLRGSSAQHSLPEINEIAHALSMINRFTGHTTRPYSVAEHSLLVAQMASEEGASPITQLAALLHDAHEAFTGDVSSPAKWSIGQPWDDFEHGQAISLHNALGIRAAMVAHRGDIKRWDLIALATERRDLTAWQRETSTPWPILDTPGLEVLPYREQLNTPARTEATWQDWRIEFLCKFTQLRERVAGPMQDQATVNL